MKVTIHASLDFRDELISAKRILEQHGIEVVLPDLTPYQHIRDENGDEESFTAIKHRLTRENMLNIRRSDCVLILNYDHRGVKNYVGGNSFVEMVIAFYLGRTIYLLNDVPEGMPYSEEMKAFYPIVIRSIEGFSEIASQQREDRSP